MKYLCLIYNEEKKLDTMSRSEWEAFVAETLAYDGELRQKGHFIAAQTLQGAKTAMTVRVRSGKVSITEGPVAETKEMLGGFILIDARDLNEAIQAAAKMPEARVGSIEVRPIRQPDQKDRRALVRPKHSPPGGDPPGGGQAGRERCESSGAPDLPSERFQG